VTRPRRVIVAAAIIAFATLGVSRDALACPACFGDANAPMTIAANNGIWFMLGVVGAMLTAFASFFVYLMRRARHLAEESASPGEAGPFVEGREGTAQC
jgi:hypothetical protein